MNKTSLEEYLSFINNCNSDYKIYNQKAFDEHMSSKISPFLSKFFIIIALIFGVLSSFAGNANNLEAAIFTGSIFVISLFLFVFISIKYGDAQTIKNKFIEHEWVTYTHTPFLIKKGYSILHGYITSASSFQLANRKFLILNKIKGKNEEEQIKIVKEYLSDYINSYDFSE